MQVPHPQDIVPVSAAISSESPVTWSKSLLHSKFWDPMKSKFQPCPELFASTRYHWKVLVPSLMA